jgi:L-fuconolactonase
MYNPFLTVEKDFVRLTRPGTRFGPFRRTADDLAPFVNHAAEVFGKDRIMFGGDWPVCTQTATYRQWFEALKIIVGDWSEEDRKKLFHDNAAKFYGLG